MEANSLRRAIKSQQSKTLVGWEILEQDYALSWVLYGISKIEKLRSTLIFKGGTALKKCYFGYYRFSQDLDFSALGDYPSREELLDLMIQACHVAQNQSGNIDFRCKRYPERAPHPEKQEAFIIHARFPWHRDYNTPVKVEVTIQEEVLLSPNHKKIIHGYNEEFECHILTYQIEEIIGEKIRAILQFSKKLHERGWGRSRIRDYYDLWRILGEYGKFINHSLLPNLIREKCAPKQVVFNSVEDLFQENLMEALQEWDVWLKPIVPNYPDKDIVLQELQQQLKAFLP